MTKQEALEELKTCVRGADWVDEDYCDCVSKEALKVAIETLTRETSHTCRLDKIASIMARIYDSGNVMGAFRYEEIGRMFSYHCGLLESIDQYLIEGKKESMEVGIDLVGDLQREAMFSILEYCGYDYEILGTVGMNVVKMRISKKPWLKNMANVAENLTNPARV